MNRYLFGAWLLVAVMLPGYAATASESTLDFGAFGKLALYAPPTEPAHVVLFVSGDGGWNLGVVDMARALAQLDALVVGIDITHYLRSLEQSKEQCVYFAGDLEGLSQFVQKKLGYKDYRRPILVGYSSGATLVYAALGAGPAGTFAGAISLGFCPDLMLRKPVCRGSGLHAQPNPILGQVFDPVREMSSPWVVLHGDQDQVCSQAQAQRFTAQVKGSEVIALPKVDGFSVQRNWLPQFRQAFQRMASQNTPAPPPPAVSGLPLVEVPVATGGDTLAVLLTGDGGWAGIDRDLAAGLASQGIPVVGWDSLRYLWTARKPEEVGADLERVLRHYLSAWHRERVLLIGYSLGAETVPVMASRLPADLKARVDLVALLAPGRTGRLDRCRRRRRYRPRARGRAAGRRAGAVRLRHGRNQRQPVPPVARRQASGGRVAGGASFQGRLPVAVAPGPGSGGERRQWELAYVGIKETYLCRPGAPCPFRGLSGLALYRNTSIDG